ncbi:MAG: peroxiredoxin [Pyrinomonadaceae bacterium]
MSNRTHGKRVGQMRGLAVACAAALVFAAAVASVAQTQSADGARASEKKAAGAASGERAGASADAPKAAPAAPPKVGEAAPDFKLPYATQEKIFMKPEDQMSLSGLRGKNVILAFYPADWSGGCTAEVCTFRDTFMEFGKLNATVLGISGDYVFSHHEWAKHHKLPFPLLSDHDHRVARAYDSYMEQYGMNKRTIYLIDKDGVVRYVNPAFKAGDKKDYDTLRAELEKLK